MKGIVSFYEKPGCKEHVDQKKKLRNAGYMLQVVNIMEKAWEKEVLIMFFRKGVRQCVDMSARDIVTGECIPSKLSDEELLDKMVDSPDLIKAPLLFFRGSFDCGFDSALAEILLSE